DSVLFSHEMEYPALVFLFRLGNRKTTVDKRASGIYFPLRFVERALLKSPEEHPGGRVVCPYSGRHHTEKRFASVLFREFPGSVMLIPGGIGQTVIPALLDQVIIFFKQCDLFSHFVLLFLREFSRVKLIAEGSCHSHHRPCVKRSGSSGLV